MDEAITGKVTDALIEPYETSNWEKHNIYFSKEEEVVPKIVSDVIIRHKREYVIKMIGDIKQSLSEEGDNADNYRKIIKLNELRKEIDAELYRIL